MASGSLHTYRISAINSDSTGIASNGASDTTYPGTPTSLVATASGSTAIDLVWVAPTVGAVDGYKIERESPTGNGFFILVADTGNTNVTYSDTLLTPGTQYNYRVTALNGADIGSTASNEDDAITSPDTNDDLVAYLGFDGNTDDYSGNQNDGTVTGAERYSTGPMNTSFKFDGSTYISLANEFNFDFAKTDPFSYSYWMKAPSSETGVTETILSKKSAGTSGNAGWVSYFTGSDTLSNRFHDGSGSQYSITSSQTLRDDTWHHIAFTFSGNSDRSGEKLYIDGTSEVNGTSSSITNDILNNEPVYVGAFSALGGDEFTGSLDDIRVYDVELNSTQVQSIYEESPFVQIANNDAEIDDLYDFWTDLKDSIITWLAGRP